MKTILQILILFAVTGGMLYGQTVIHPWNVVDRGGGRSSAGGVTLQSSIGQSAVVASSPGAVNLEEGYIPGLRRFTGTTSSMEYMAEASWNMVSVPLIVSDFTKTAVYPSAISAAFAYAAGYISTGTLENSVGYWVRFDSAESVLIQGTGITEDSADVTQGWNMIGCLSYPVLTSEIEGVSPTTVVASIFGYSPGSGYFAEDTLKPGYGYWVKVSNTGKLVLKTGSVMLEPGNPPMLSQVKKRPDGDGSVFSSGKWSSLTIEDGTGQCRTLYYSASAGEIDLETYEMPPLPPAGLDIRYGSNLNVETAEGDKSQPIRITGAVYPLTIHWDSGEEATLLIDGKETPLTGSGDIRIEKPAVEISLRLSPTSVVELPKEFALAQNYPNPFNPSTIIEYALPTAEHVQLSVYNMLGQVVTNVIDEVQVAGYKSITFDARELPSGMYFYRITAGTFTNVKKMLLLQ